MASTQDDFYSKHLKDLGTQAHRLLSTNLKDIDNATAFAIVEDFRTLHFDLDAIPMTRKQRDEIDLKFKTLGLLLEQQ